MRIRSRLAAVAIAAALAWSAAPAHAAWRGGVANSVATELDPWAASFYAVCATKRVASYWRGPLVSVRRQTDGSTMDVYPRADGWLDVAAMNAWLQGSVAFVTACYDQSGNGNNLTQASAAAQPTIGLAASYPTIHFDAGPTVPQTLQPPLATVSSVSGLTAVMVRARSGGAADTTWTNGYYAAQFNTPTASNTQLAMGMDPSRGKEVCEGRRVAADSLVRSSGFAVDALWHPQTCVLDFTAGQIRHQLSASTETATLASTGTTISGNGSGAALGSNVNAQGPWAGDITLFAMAQTAAASASVAAWTTALQDLVPTASPGGLFQWPATSPIYGSEITAQPSGLAYTIVIAPSGLTPVLSDPTTHQYHHHTRVAYWHGRQWVAASSSATIEQGAGLASVITSSANNWATQTALAYAIPPQGVWGDTTSAEREVQPREFETYNGGLYLISQITGNVAGGGLALVAVQCNDDGSLGTPFIISPAAYTAPSGYPQYAYDPVNGPPLFALSNVYGQWDDGLPTDAWQGVHAQGGANLMERGTIPLDTTGKNLAFIWRVVGGNATNYSFVSQTSDGGATSSVAVPSNIPNNNSPVTGALLPDGRIVTVGSPFSGRNMTYLAVWNAGGQTLQSLRALATTAGVRPYIANSSTNGACSATYDSTLPQNNCAPWTAQWPATGKGGGCAYPGVWVDTVDSVLLVSCSLVKERIALFTIPLGSL